MYIVIAGLKFGYWPSVAVRINFVVGDNDGGGGGSEGGGVQNRIYNNIIIFMLYNNRLSKKLCSLRNKQRIVTGEKNTCFSTNDWRKVSL